MSNLGTMLLSEKARSYNSKLHEDLDVKDKQNAPCSTHPQSGTSVLHTQLQRPQASNALLVLSLTLADISEGRGCTQCLMKEAARTVAICAREMRAAKKDGEWSKEERKAMKKEFKAALQEIKQEVRVTWKDKN